jgi:serine/threonine-protein kinase
MPTTVAQEGAGALQVVVRPWADVSIDGTPHGETPFDRIPLPSGPHVVQLRHPRYGLVEKRITIEPGRTEKIVVDMSVEGEPP